MHTKKNTPEHDYGSSGGGYPLPPNSTTAALVLITGTIYLIACWIQALEQNLL